MNKSPQAWQIGSLLMNVGIDLVLPSCGIYLYYITKEKPERDR